MAALDRDRAWDNGAPVFSEEVDAAATYRLGFRCCRGLDCRHQRGLGRVAGDRLLWHWRRCRDDQPDLAWSTRVDQRRYDDHQPPQAATDAALGTLQRLSRVVAELGLQACRVRIRRTRA